EQTMMSRNSGWAQNRLLLAFSLVGMAVFAGQPLFAQIPYHGTDADAGTLWWITQTGSGGAGKFEISNAANTKPALYGVTNGTGPAVQGVSSNGGYGVYGYTTQGGKGVYGYNSGTGNYG